MQSETSPARAGRSPTRPTGVPGRASAERPPMRELSDSAACVRKCPFPRSRDRWPDRAACRTKGHLVERRRGMPPAAAPARDHVYFASLRDRHRSASCSMLWSWRIGSRDEGAGPARTRRTPLGPSRPRVASERGWGGWSVRTSRDEHEVRQLRTAARRVASEAEAPPRAREREGGGRVVLRAHR